MSTLIEIDKNLSERDNLHVLINKSMLTPLEVTDYTVDDITVIGDGDFYNTSVVLNSATEKYSGSVTKLYHRVNISKLGTLVDGNYLIGVNVLGAGALADETDESLTTKALAIVPLVNSNFTITKDVAKNTFTLAATDSNLLYTGSITFRYVVSVGGTIPATIEAFSLPSLQVQP